MGRIPLVLTSVAGGAVLFVGTSVAILASQGRLGAALSAEKPEGDAAHVAKPGAAKSGEGPRAEKTPIGASLDPTAHADSGASPNAKGAETANPEAGKTHATTAEGMKPSAKGGAKPLAESATEDGGSATASSHDKPESTIGSSPKRVATAGLVQHFTLPSPYTAQDLEELVGSLREARAAVDRDRLQNAEEKSAIERDRLENQVRTEELNDLRQRLDAEKALVEARIGELAKQSLTLGAAEDRFVKVFTGMLGGAEDDAKATAMLLELDDRMAAQVLRKLEPRNAGRILASLPSEKRISLTQAIRGLVQGDKNIKVPGAK